MSIKKVVKPNVPIIPKKSAKVTGYGVWITYNEDTKQVSSTVRINFKHMGEQHKDILHVSAEEANHIIDILRNEKPVRIELGNPGLIVLAAGYEAGGESVGKGE